MGKQRASGKGLSGPSQRSYPHTSARLRRPLSAGLATMVLSLAIAPAGVATAETHPATTDRAAQVTQPQKFWGGVMALLHDPPRQPEPEYIDRLFDTNLQLDSKFSLNQMYVSLT